MMRMTEETNKFSQFSVVVDRYLPYHRIPGWPDGDQWLDEGAGFDASFHLRELLDSRSASKRNTQWLKYKGIKYI